MKSLPTVFVTVFISILVYISQTFSTGQEWVARYNGGANNADWGYAVALDQAGNVIVTGYSTGSTTGKDCLTIKYNPAGAVIWTASFNGPVNGGDYSYAVVLDASDNVYITGRADYGAPLADIVTIKYNSNGVQQWLARYSGTANGVDEGKVIQVDASGNVYVSGKTFVTGSAYDFITIKYNSSGVQQWVSTYNGPGNNEDLVNSLAVDNSGNVYTAGVSIGQNTGSDFTVVKYNADGTEAWVKRYNGSANGGDAAVSVKVDASGNVFAAGYTDRGSTSRYDMITVKYNSAGTQQWMSFYTGNGQIDDFATAMVIDGNSNVYLTGASASVATFYDSNYATVKYNSDGVQQWAVTYNGPNNSVDVSRSIFVDNAQNVYITGTSSGANSDDYVSIKYNANGTTGWVLSYNGPASSNDYSTSIVADNSGNAYVTGRSFGAGTDYDYATIKYGDLVGINPVSNTIPERFHLYQNYPNPFNPSSKIKFDLPASSDVTLKIYNISGMLITQESFGSLRAATYEYNFVASGISSGIYFYEISAGTYKDTKKMVLVK
jgi:uncharacterized delta-60 repeat protein